MTAPLLRRLAILRIRLYLPRDGACYDLATFKGSSG